MILRFMETYINLPMSYLHLTSMIPSISKGNIVNSYLYRNSETEFYTHRLSICRNLQWLKLTGLKCTRPLIDRSTHTATSKKIHRLYEIIVIMSGSDSYRRQLGCCLKLMYLCTLSHLVNSTCFLHVYQVINLLNEICKHKQ